MSVERPYRVAPGQKALLLLIDSEKVQIVHLRKSEVLGSPTARYSTCRSFYEKWEQIDVFAGARGRPQRILKDVEDVIIGKSLLEEPVGEL
jgi:hypothetical protein